MKGTLISILVGALAGALLTFASNVHASHAAATRARHARVDLTTPTQVEPGTASGSADAPAPPSEQSPLPQ